MYQFPQMLQKLMECHPTAEELHKKNWLNTLEFDRKQSLCT